MKNKKNNTDSNAKKVLAWIPYILIPILIISGVSLYARQQKNEKLEYYQVVQYFDEKKVTEYNLNMSSGALEFKLKGDDKTYNFTVPSVGMFQEDIHNGVIAYNREHPDTPIKAQYQTGSTGAILLNIVPTLLMLVILGAILFYMFRKMNNAMNNENNRTLSFGKARVKRAKDESRKTTFDDVAGADEEKEELSEIVDFLKDPSHFNKLGARIPRGVLLVGPPGTGKTLLARAVAGEANVPFFSISGSDFVEMYVGVGASRVRDLFNEAKKNSPSIIFIDEIDAVGRHRGAGMGGGHDEREQTLNQLLVEMDGFTNNEGVIVMAATNRADILDNALLRPGRFDRRVYMGLPDIKGREEILKVHARGKPLGDDVDLKSIARGTAGFAGADLENLLNEAAIMATRSKRRFIMQADIDEAILKVVMGPEKKSRVVSERARRLTAYHESGHAIASFFLKNSDPVHYITIIPRGAAGGFTWYRKAEDAENFTSRGEMFDSIVSALGGRIAEQLFLDDISTGASNDIQQATNIARDMVMKYGMSEKLGPISFDDSSHSIFIGRDFGTTKSYSEETAATIDEEVKHLFDQAYAKCEALLREHADLLTGLAEYLLIHETIEGDDFRYYCEHGVMPVHPDDTIEPPAKVIRRMDEAPETPQPDAEAPAQPEAPSAPDADAPNSDPGEQL